MKIRLSHFTSGAAHHPSGSVNVEAGLQLVGGGAIVNWNGQGQLLTASYPEGSTWQAAAKDHFEDDPSTITVYAMGAQPS